MAKDYQAKWTPHIWLIFVCCINNFKKKSYENCGFIFLKRKCKMLNYNFVLFNSRKSLSIMIFYLPNFKTTFTVVPSEQVEFTGLETHHVQQWVIHFLIPVIVYFEIEQRFSASDFISRCNCLNKISFWISFVKTPVFYNVKFRWSLKSSASR